MCTRMQLAVLCLFAAASVADGAAKCSTVDPETFCAGYQVAAPTDDDADAMGDTVPILKDDATSIDCAGDACVKADQAACCAPCTIGMYINNDVGVCENDCDKCEQKDGKSVGCDHCFCALTERAPQLSKVPLNICHMYTENSCCFPVIDTEIDEHYNNLLEAGDRCMQELVKPKLFLRDLYCMACSPKQPIYLVNQTLQICRSLVDEVKPEYFDECGIVQVAERGNLCAGDDSVMPSLTWETAADFVNDATGAKPVFLEDWAINIVEDNENCYGRSAAPQGFAPLMLMLIQLGMLGVALFGDSSL